VRQFALEQLQVAGEEAAVRQRHLGHLVSFTEGLRAHLAGEDQLHWHRRAEAEHDNIRIALQWAEQCGLPVLGLRILNALHRHWYKTMQWGEVAQWQQRLTQQHAAAGGVPDVHVARSYVMAGMLATNLDPATGRRLCQRAAAISRERGFLPVLAWATMWLAHLDQRLRQPATAQAFEESLRLGERIEDPWERAFFLGNALVCYANYEAAMNRDESALAMLRDCELQIALAGHDAVFIGHARALQATMAVRRGELERAAALAAQSLALHRSVDSRFDAGAILAQQGLIALERRLPQDALDLFKQSLRHHRHHPGSQWVTKGLAHLMVAHAACEAWEVAAQLAGSLGLALEKSDTAPGELSGRVAQAFRRAVEATQTALGAASFTELAAMGALLTRDQAIDLALGQ
jgi:tetratricopeptide (TPR) repeat protein